MADIKRNAEEIIIWTAGMFPVVLLTGPRQWGNNMQLRQVVIYG
jgi:hypothetical protein